MTIAFMGIDLAKNVFQLHGVDADGNAVFKKRVRREGLLAELADIPACRIEQRRGLQDDQGNEPAGKLRCVRNLAFIMAIRGRPFVEAHHAEFPFGRAIQPATPDRCLQPGKRRQTKTEETLQRERHP